VTVRQRLRSHRQTLTATQPWVTGIPDSVPGAGGQPGIFTVEPDLAERWEALDDTTYIFHLRKGVKWHNKPPLNSRELVAEDVKCTYDRFLTETGNANR
jgi:ABC-type transport system substrate-binding protein